ncbi:MAG: hypothetical protein IPM04_13205 [Saprospiraceae bacterium]|nr:hypothetical protein [Candidatus Brachybacter algidus]MBK8748775.1 hypothetical protein [Candidatus Brachybacter algidus]
MSRVRLLKVVVQPVFVVDDGETLTEQVADAFTVNASAWRDFADEGGAFDQGCAALVAQADPPEQAPGVQSE